MAWQPVSWEWLGGSPRRMLIRFDAVDCNLHQFRVVYTERTEEAWNHAGDICAWDGDLERPTLEGSIMPLGPDNEMIWHGWLRKGEFVPV